MCANASSAGRCGYSVVHGGWRRLRWEVSPPPERIEESGRCADSLARHHRDLARADAGHGAAGFRRTARLSSRSGMNVSVSRPADLGAAVRHARRSLGVSQDLLAASAGVGPRFVVELEAGKPTVQFEKMLAVLAALGLKLEIAGVPDVAAL